MITRLWAFLTGRRAVWLQDHDGGYGMSIEDVSPWGERCAERYWPWSIRKVRLLDGGKVDGSYVVRWKYVD